MILIPSLYFINGDTGMPIEVVGGSVSEDKLLEKIKLVNVSIFNIEHTNDTFSRINAKCCLLNVLFWKMN